MSCYFLTYTKKKKTIQHFSIFHIHIYNEIKKKRLYDNVQFVRMLIKIALQLQNNLVWCRHSFDRRAHFMFL